jgi:Tol biopolymer transport system component
MNVRTRIKLFAVLLGISNVTTLVLIDFTQSLRSQLVVYTPVVLCMFVVIFFFYRGKNWARLLVLIGAVIGLMGFALVFFGKDTPGRVLYAYDGALSLLLLWQLNRAELREYFKPSPPPAGAVKRRLPTGIKILFGVLAGLAVVVGSIVFLVHRFLEKVEHTAIWVEDLRVGTLRPVTGGEAASFPRYSPDGKCILFRQSGALKTLSLEDGAVHVLVEDARDISNPSWGFDGTCIYYRSEREDRVDLWVMDLEKGEENRLTDDENVEDQPKPSPDGKWLMFTQSSEPHSGELYLMPAQGGVKTRLTDTKDFLHRPQDPSWSSDSSEIVFISFISLVVVNLEGEVVQELRLEGLSNVSTPRFHPLDSDLIIFKARNARDLLGGFNLYAASRVAGRLAVLRKSSLTEMFYDLSPDGESIAFSAPLR